ncbi:type II toxin-antitoxin system ParD family antitoxin [Blastopirellula marina]|uniref:Type II toxin-antitoxin system ParD family antitoxin n=1 Tax=Blastopirellula marina TaxID=124 RepID=A0A2S8G965_9BACT|nr:type II toxin-antitoxin system ParD family antitoxin [Blastopirellula marina]PQO40850.1 hypothetical protein C5Y98_04535 [Blastopirellula marina]PTL45732.1 hypothetical protein C5Y97_04535 [Blastopirellula marina]
MIHEFPPDLEQQLQAQMATGRYRSEVDLIREALNALGQQSEDLAAVEAGLDDLNEGRVRSLTDVASEIRQKHGWSS